MKYGREILRDVEGYTPGEQPRIPNLVKLNTNENPYPPSPKVMEALAALTPAQITKYPDPVALELRAECAKRHGFDGPEWIVAGNGMDELLALALRTFVDPGDTVLTVEPTYTLYEVLVKLHGARLTSVPLNADFQLSPAFFDTPARLCFLPRPNAPTGVCAAREDIERFCRHFDGIVVVDEAYVDFSDNHCMDLPKQFDNVIVMRTFSKSFSLAGLRLGIAAARPEIINEFMKTKDSYNLNAATQAAGLAAMHDYDHMLASSAKVRATRQRLTEALNGLGFVVPPSQANFVLARWSGSPNTAALFQQLRDEGILVRYFNHPGLEDCLRITVGTDAEIDRLLEALAGMVGGNTD